ncbi:MAG: 3-isopropylmalate dehydratase small subunit [Alphaproteobacteria bacterium]|nr:3-isopropylmalate dehydratase small subunit [Alphaproteobacteria bacterium]
MPEPLISFSAIAAPLPQSNVDTDKILPASFLKTVERRGLGRGLFHAMRFDDEGRPRPDFVLNKAPWDQAGILIALENFGSGSSREHAPWALMDFGIRAVLAPSFADIFKQNCTKNGILPAVVAREDIDKLLDKVRQPNQARLNINIQEQVIEDTEGRKWHFEIDVHDKSALLSGEDDISRSLEYLDDIRRHLEDRASARPWVNAIAI